MELRIEQEFKNKIPPLTEAEFAQLRENIINDGEIYEPIVAWRNIIIDGHNRWKIHLEFPDIPYRVREMDFADKWEAFDWMYKKQLGRRNLTDEQRTVLIGKMYEARKHTESFKGNQYTTKSGAAQNEPKQTTAETIATELGIGSASVKRAEQFSKGIDTLQAVSPEAADKVLQGGSGATKTMIQNLPKAEKKEVEDVAKQIISGELKRNEQKKRVANGTSERQTARKINAMIDEISEIMSTNHGNDYSLENALEEMKVLEQEFTDKARRFLQIRKTVISGSEKMANLIDQIAENVKALKGEL